MRALSRSYGVVVLGALLVPLTAAAEEPKPTESNTISVKLENDVKPQTFPRPLKFFIENVVDRSANPQPLLVYKPRGVSFLTGSPPRLSARRCRRHYKNMTCWRQNVLQLTTCSTYICSTLA